MRSVTCRLPVAPPPEGRGLCRGVSPPTGTSVLRVDVANDGDLCSLDRAPRYAFHPSKNPTHTQRLAPHPASAPVSRCLLRAHSARFPARRLLLHPSQGDGRSSSRSSSAYGTGPRSSVSTGVTEPSPSMGFRSPPGLPVLHGRSRFRSPTRAPDTSGGRRASRMLHHLGSPRGSRACVLSPALHPGGRSTSPAVSRDPLPSLRLPSVWRLVCPLLFPKDGEVADPLGVFRRQRSG